MHRILDELKEAIGRAEVISFDIFDTLILRKVNTPEDIFYAMESYLKLPSFAEQRMSLQTKASLEAADKLHKPHADLDDIYAVMARESYLEADWEAVKQLEIGIEYDAAMPNPEIMPVYKYALESGKRVIATSDMYLTGDLIRRMLDKCGYTGLEAVYVSADLNATKYNADLYDCVAKKEGVDSGCILHIGDNRSADYEMAMAAGWKAWHYEPFKWAFEEHDENIGLLDHGIGRAVGCQSGNFWYSLGAYAGGPLYLGVLQWFREQMAAYPADRVLLLARDGFNLYHLLKDRGVENVSYLKMSRRSLLLAGIDHLEESMLDELPPFSTGQTMREVLAYLKMDQEDWQHLDEVGFKSLDDVIRNEADMKAMRRFYKLNEDLFLKRCAVEHKAALKYLKSMGLGESSLIFDCGWNGSSQYILDRFLANNGLGGHDRFSYIGILDTEKSRRQLKNAAYDTYLFDYNKNRTMQDQVYRAIALFELFFGAPENSVWYYGEEGPVPEDLDNDESYKNDILAGIRDFVREAWPFADKYGIRYSDENAVSGVSRLIRYPTEEEAVKIGDLANVDGFAAKKNKKTYMAKLTLQEYKDNPNTELYWPQGLVARPDIEDELKAIIIGKYEMNKGDDKTLVTVPKTAQEAAEENLSDRARYKLNKKRYGKRTADLLMHRSQDGDESDYDRWIKRHEFGSRVSQPLAVRPFFSVVIPVYNVSDGMLTACIDSVLGQTYDNFELILVDDCSTWESVRACLNRYKDNSHVRLIFREENGHISKATNTGIEAAKGDFIVFSDCDDVLAKEALYEFASLLNDRPELDFIYSDEDKLTEDGQRRHSPFFKPDWSPDTFMCLMYTNHLAAYRRTKVLETGLLRSQFDGTQDYDFTLRFMEHTDNRKVGHVPKVLYHWRERKGSIAVDMKAKPYAVEAMRLMKEEMLKRRGIKGRVSFINDISQYRVVYDAPDKALISIIIPSKDHPELLKTCIDSVMVNAAGISYEIIIVDNGSDDVHRAETEAYIKDKPVRYLYEPAPFNFSAMCNRGAAAASGNFLMFLNDDIEVITRDWLAVMAGAASQAHIGAVGAKLLYPNSPEIQHLGITNLQIGPSHSLMGFNDHHLFYFGRNRADYDWLAVTAAALMVEKTKFDQVGGFDETLGIAYNDVELCFRLYEAGYYNTVRNDVIMYHYESASRGVDDISDEKMKRLLAERGILYDKHPDLAQKDPFYNVNLTTRKVNYDLDMPITKDSIAPCRTVNEALHDYDSEFDYIVDDIEETDGFIQIRGWYFTGEPLADNESDIYAVLSSGRSCFSVKCQKTLREDVRDNINSQAYYVGYTVAVDSACMRPEDEYELGFLIVRPKGQKLFRTMGQMVRRSAARASSPVPMQIDLPPSQDKVSYALDRFEIVGRRLIVEGWAFINEIRDHEETVTKIAISDTSRHVFLAQTGTIERRDVARLFVPHRHLDECGFRVSLELPPVEVERISLMLYDPGSGNEYVRDLPFEKTML